MRTLLLALLLATAGGSAGWWAGLEISAAQREDEARAAGKAARAVIERMRSAEAVAHEVRRLREETVALLGVAASGSVLGGLVLWAFVSTRPRRRRVPSAFVCAWLGSWAQRRAQRAGRAAERDRKAG